MGRVTTEDGEEGGLTDVMRSVEVREEAMSLALPLRLGVGGADELGQFLEVDELFRGARIEPAMERLSAALVANEAVDAAREEEV